MYRSTYAQEIKRILASMDNNGSEEPKDTKQLEEKEKPEAFDVYVEEDRITVVKRSEPQPQVIDAVHQSPQRQPPPYVAYAVMTISLLLLSFLITSAFSTVFFPPVVTIMIMPKSQTISLTGTVQLGKLLPPITISQSQTVPTTGKGHQTARSATGFITFYNGLFTSQTIQAGTILTGADGIQVVTDQDAYIPEAYPPNLGHATVSAHADQAGSNGNIQAYDINQACCATAIKAINTTAFHGGKDERNYQTVAGQDINNAVSPLKSSLSLSMQGALTAERKAHETVITLPCSPTVTPNHNVGEEATQVTVSVSEACSGIAYDTKSLKTRATQLLTTQAYKKLGTGYSLLGDVQTSVKQEAISHTTTPLVFVSFTASGTWVNALNSTEQQRMKRVIAGKTKREALQLLSSMPGIERASIGGIDDLTKLPKSTRNIQFVLIV